MAKSRHEDAGAVGIYAWCADIEETPGGIESQIGHLARYLAGLGVRVVVHCLAGDTAGWHVRDKQFRVGGQLISPRRGLHVFLPAHGPGVEGAIAENLAVSGRLDESVVLAFGIRDSYVFDVAAAVARERDKPAVAFYYHSADERQFRSQFTARAPGVPGLASDKERVEFEAHAVGILRRLGRDFAAVVVPTEYLRGQLSAVLPPADMAKVVVAYHGVDPGAFPPRSAAWDGAGPWLHVSRCTVPNALHKNFLWSCELVRDAVKAGPPLAERARLELCGPGNAGPLIREFARQNNVIDRITATGAIAQRDLAAKYRHAAFLLVPSMMEAGCTVIVEAVLSGCAPIVLDYAGSGEVMRRLGLSHLLIRGIPRRYPYVLHDGTATGAQIDAIEPDLEAAGTILAECVRRPADTAEALSGAAAVARAQFAIEPSVKALHAGLLRLGVDLGPPRPSSPRAVAGQDGGEIIESA